MAFAMKREIKGSIRSQSKRRIIALAIGFEVIAFSAFDTAWKNPQRGSKCLQILHFRQHTKH